MALSSLGRSCTLLFCVLVLAQLSGTTWAVRTTKLETEGTLEAELLALDQQALEPQALEQQAEDSADSMALVLRQDPAEGGTDDSTAIVVSEEETTELALTPDSDIVACEKLPYWRKERLNQEAGTNPKVLAMMATHEAGANYTELMRKVVHETGRRFPGRWDVQAIHKLIWDGKWEETFKLKNLFINIRQKAALIGSDLSICFIEAEHVGMPPLDFVYTDSKNPMGQVLQRGVVAVITTPTVNTDQNYAESTKLRANTAEAVDQSKFVALYDIAEEHTALKAAVDISLSTTPDEVALKLLDVQIEHEDAFVAKNVDIVACYKKQKRNWLHHVVGQLLGGSSERALRYSFWFEYIARNITTDYMPEERILREQVCEPLPTTKNVMTLEVKALIMHHNLFGKYKQMHRTLRLLLAPLLEAHAEHAVKADSIYRTLWSEGYDDYFLARNVKLWLTHDHAGNNFEICYHDMNKAPDAPAGQIIYQDGNVVRRGDGDGAEQDLKQLGNGAIGEPLLEANQKLVFKSNAQTPVDVSRLLAAKGALQLHEQLAGKVLALPPSPYGWIAEDVHVLVKEEFAKSFWQKGLGIYVCTRTKALNFCVGDTCYDTAFQYFNWIEYVDVLVNPDYMPDERVYDPNEVNYTLLLPAPVADEPDRLIRDHAHAQASPLLGASLCAVALVVLRPGALVIAL